MNATPLFSLGQIVTTPRALDQLPRTVIDEALLRHAQGDWGDVCREDAHDNWLSIFQSQRLHSAYAYPELPRFWVITEADRSATTVLLPGDY